MTHSMHCDRKKKREDECDDFDHYIPATKRMKKNNRDQDISPTSDQSVPSYPSQQSVFPVSNKDHVFSTSQISQIEFQSNSINCNIAQYNQDNYNNATASINHPDFKYLPTLNAVENPHYYENNRLLFELYVERVQRTASSPESF